MIESGLYESEDKRFGLLKRRIPKPYWELYDRALKKTIGRYNTKFIAQQAADNYGLPDYQI